MVIFFFNYMLSFPLIDRCKATGKAMRGGRQGRKARHFQNKTGNIAQSTSNPGPFSKSFIHVL